jgi:hypothetical protein
VSVREQMESFHNKASPIPSQINTFDISVDSSLLPTEDEEGSRNPSSYSSFEKGGEEKVIL